MNSLLILPENSTPLVDFSPDGNLWMVGDIFPVDGCLFFNDIFNWVDEYIRLKPENTSLNIEIFHHNDSGSKYLLQMIHLLENGGTTLEIYWFCNEDDDEVKFLGNCIASLIRSGFHFVKI